MHVAFHIYSREEQEQGYTCDLGRRASSLWMGRGMNFNLFFFFGIFD